MKNIVFILCICCIGCSQDPNCTVPSKIIHGEDL